MWRKPGERLSPQCVKKTVKFGGGGVMVWGMMSAAGVGPIVCVQGTLSAEFYKRLLIQHAVPNLQSTTGQSAIFMQDNAPCHKARSVMFFQEKNIEVMD